MFKLGGIVVGIVLVGILIFSLCSIVTIDPGFVGVVYNTNGGIEDQVLSQGWHFKSIFERITEYPISTETIYLSKSTKEGEKEDTSINVGTSDGKEINLDISYSFHFEPTKLKDVFNKFRGSSVEVIADTYIRRFLKDTINAVSTQFELFDVYGAKRQEVATKTFIQLQKALLADGIIVDGVSILEVRPDEQTKQAIQNKVNAIQALAQLKVERDRATIEADKKRIEAEGESAKQKIQADAQAYANEKVQQSMTPQILQKLWIEKWNGTVPNVEGSNAGIMMQMPTK